MQDDNYVDHLRAEGDGVIKLIVFPKVERGLSRFTVTLNCMLRKE